MKRSPWTTLGVVSAVSFQNAIVLSIVFIAFPDLVDDFPHSSDATLSWVINVFTIAGASTLVLASVLSERWGRRRSILIGTAAFGLSSVVAGLAPGVGVLIAARAVQALSSSLTLPATAAVLADAFPSNDEGRRSVRGRPRVRSPPRSVRRSGPWWSTPAAGVGRFS